MSFADAIVNLAPTRLQGPWGQKFLATAGFVLDVITQVGLEGVRARFPSFAPPDALPYIGLDRGIRRGFVESEDAYRLRLRRWLDGWRIAGNPFSILQELQGYFTPYAVRLRTVSNNGTWFTIDETGTKSILKLQGNFNWDAEPTYWSRFWVLVYPLTTGAIAPGPTCGSGAVCGQTNLTLGTTATPDMVSSVREIVRDRKPLGVSCMNIIICFDASSFNPSSAPGAPMPDGTWIGDGVYVGGTKQPGRNLTARYWDGTYQTVIG